ncbi:MAG TPA: glycerophosphodiester phosphodiesterase family protein [Candidatus Nanoarchaeia archaeon]|nr:glycerophosphodiester phosphodiesterase family protein [Candidatus Nanoarchaeia archaeon]
MALEVYAHRGLHRKNYPENTIPAFTSALKYTLRLEFDVRQTKDRHVVVFHDDRIDNVTFDTGLVSNLPLAMLQNLRTRIRGSKIPSKQHIPTLEEVLASCSKALASSPNKARYQIELKAPGVLEPTLRVLNKNKVPEANYFFTSFYPKTLQEAQAQAPKIKRLLLIPPEKLIADALLDIGSLQTSGLEFQGVGLGDSLPGLFKDKLNRVSIAKFQDLGLKIGCYVVDSPARAENLESWGVDGIVTNRCDLFREFIEKRAVKH